MVHLQFSTQLVTFTCIYEIHISLSIHLQFSVQLVTFRLKAIFQMIRIYIILEILKMEFEIANYTLRSTACWKLWNMSLVLWTFLAQFQVAAAFMTKRVHSLGSCSIFHIFAKLSLSEAFYWRLMLHAENWKIAAKLEEEKMLESLFV